MNSSAENSHIVIIGASGDLSRRKLLPALYNLFRQDLLPQNCLITGCARRDWNDQTFLQHAEESLRSFSSDEKMDDFLKWLKDHLRYYSLDVANRESYSDFESALTISETEMDLSGSRLYYLAVAPEHISEIILGMGRVGMTDERKGVWRRVVIEKPFGRDLETARALNRHILSILNEKQIYRIDHYLGKETVQNILVFRFANGIFEPLWNRNYIDHIQVTVAETMGVGNRADYYDHAGALRDMVPNHIFQLISLISMEPPSSFAADAVRNEQVKTIAAIQTLDPEDILNNTVRGQYGPGMEADKKVIGYREEKDVAFESQTETFIAARVMIDNWRWAGVPFYFRTGKRMPVRTTEIVIQFKQAPHKLFHRMKINEMPPNRLIMGIQPNEGIYLSIGAKIPGPIVDIGSVNLRFQYDDYFGSRPSTGYERLLYDALTGDATLFQRADMVEAGWHVVAPIQDVWNALAERDFPNYDSGTWGPSLADRLIAQDGRKWELCSDAC